VLNDNSPDQVMTLTMADEQLIPEDC
jgi:hypothetical protein